MSHSVIVPFRHPDPIEYREIPGFPGYRVGNDGSVWSYWFRGRPTRLMGTPVKLNPNTMRSGHKQATLRNGKTKRMVLVHRLVLEVFVGPCPPGLECCHGPDNDPSNNALWNLRWDTRSSNAMDMLRCSTLSINRSKIDMLIAEKIRWEHANGESTVSLSKRYELDYTTIYDVINFVSWKYAAI